MDIYWLMSNILAIFQSLVLNKFFNPAETAAKVKAELEAQREAERQEKIEARKAAKEKQAAQNRAAAAAALSGKKGRKHAAPVREQTLVEMAEDEEIDEKALSQKEINRMKLAAARRRDAEKYGEEYVDVTDHDLE